MKPREEWMAIWIIKDHLRGVLRRKQMAHMHRLQLFVVVMRNLSCHKCTAFRKNEGLTASELWAMVLS